MCYFDEYRDCKRCGLVESRFYQYTSYNSEEDDTCMVCGDSRRVVLTEESLKENAEIKYKEILTQGFGSIHVKYKTGANKVILIEKKLDKHEIKQLEGFLSQEDIDKDNSSVMIWNEKKSELEVLFGRDLRKVYTKDKSKEEYHFEEIGADEICI